MSEEPVAQAKSMEKPTGSSIQVPENEVADIKNKQKKIEYLDNLEKNLKEAYDKVIK